MNVLVTSLFQFIEEMSYRKPDYIEKISVNMRYQLGAKSLYTVASGFVIWLIGVCVCLYLGSCQLSECHISYI